MIAECAERRGQELWEARGHWPGGSRVLEWSCLAGVRTPHGAVLADQDPEGQRGSFRGQDMVGTEAGKDRQCQSSSVRGCLCLPLCKTLCNTCGTS